MSVFVNIGGVIHTASGTLTLVGQEPPTTPTLPSRDDVEITPTLSSASSGGFTASATSEYYESGVTGSAFKAFNKVNGSGWSVGWSSTAKATTGAPQTLQIDLPVAKPCYSYALTGRSDSNALCPVSWTFEGWDGSAWCVMHTVTGATWANGETKNYTVTTPGIYSRFRWRIVDSGALCQVAEAKIFS